MAQLPQAFDVTKYDPSQGVGQLPVGSKLPVTIIESEVKATKTDANNGYIQFIVQVGQGEHAGKKGAYRINLFHSTEATRAIAEKMLSALGHVTGVFNIQDTQQLHNIPFLVDVVAQTDPKYTEVKAVYDINGNEPGRAHQQNHQQQQQAPQQPAWGGGQQQQAPQQQTTAPAWGQQQSSPEQQPQQQAPANGGWNQGGGATTPAWGQK